MLDPAAIDTALAEIDPRSRALIELFYRRGLPDSYVANLLGLDPDGLAESRAGAEDELAGVLGVDLEDLLDALPGLAESGETAEAEAVEEDDDDEEPEGAEDSGEDEDGATSGIGRWLGALAGGIAIAIIVVVVLAANGKDSKTAGTESKTTTTKTTAAAKKKAPAKPKPFPVVTFERLNGTNGKGTAQLELEGGEPRLRVKVRDFLPPQGGGYAIWLYNSDTDARQLQATTNTTFDVTLGLPADYKKFQFVDVSREPDTLPAHSNISLLRAPLAELEAR